ncbi:MAG: hypothetical protein WBB29_10360 [Geitlerinemataceae cyanobacterium]
MPISNLFILTIFNIGVYRLVQGLVGKCPEKVENWRNITEWLEDSGYKTELSVEEQI